MYKFFTVTSSGTGVYDSYGWRIGISLTGYKPIMFTLIYNNSSSSTCWAETFNSSELSGFSSRANHTITANVFYLKE